MEEHERKKIQEAIDALNTCMIELQVQVLNNVDAQMENTQSTEAEKKAVQTFVKQPIMKTVNRLSAQKLSLMKLIQTRVQQNT